MSKVISWVLKFTKFGKFNEGLKGYRGSAVFLATGLALVGKVVVDATEKGLPHLLTPVAMDDFQAIGIAFGGFFLSLKGNRIEQKIDSPSSPK